MHIRRYGAALILAAAQWGCLPVSADETGVASFYSAGPLAATSLTAAHRLLPFGTQVRVTRVDTGRHVVVLINDRGPFIAGRIIDLSPAAAEALGMTEAGVAAVRLEVMPDEKQPAAYPLRPVD